MASRSSPNPPPSALTQLESATTSRLPPATTYATSWMEIPATGIYANSWLTCSTTKEHSTKPPPSFGRLTRSQASISTSHSPHASSPRTNPAKRSACSPQSSNKTAEKPCKTWAWPTPSYTTAWFSKRHASTAPPSKMIQTWSIPTSNISSSGPTTRNSCGETLWSVALHSETFHGLRSTQWKVSGFNSNHPPSCPPRSGLSKVRNSTMTSINSSPKRTPRSPLLPPSPSPQTASPQKTAVSTPLMEHRPARTPNPR